MIIRLLLTILYLLTLQGSINLGGSIWFLFIAILYIPSSPLAYYFLNRPYKVNQQVIMLASFFLVEFGVSYCMFNGVDDKGVHALYACSGILSLLLAKLFKN